MRSLIEPLDPVSIQASAIESVSLREAFWVWLRIAMLSFGGPAGQISVMHRILVTEKRWIGDNRFLHALSYCMLLPGPEAQQLATYIGWLMHRTPGGLLAGLLFIAPGLFSIMALSWIYVLYGKLPLVDAGFIGLKSAVLAIVLEALLRVGRRALKNGTMLALALTAFLFMFVLHVAFPVVIGAAALMGWLGHRLGYTSFQNSGSHSRFAGPQVRDCETLLGESSPPANPAKYGVLGTAILWLGLWWGPVAALLFLLGPDDIFIQIAFFFSKMAVVTFGGAYAVLSYVAQQAVEHFHWLKPSEMVDGLGLAETTPGPLIMVLQFVGFLAAYRQPGILHPLWAATLGGLLTTWVTFVPCFLWIFLGAPYIERLRGQKALSAALSAITAAVVGVIANLALWFGFHTLFTDLFTLRFAGLRLDLPLLSRIETPNVVLALIAVLLLFLLKQGIVRTLLLCAGLGLAGRALGWM